MPRRTTCKLKQKSGSPSAIAGVHADSRDRLPLEQINRSVSHAHNAGCVCEALRGLGIVCQDVVFAKRVTE